MRLRRQPEGEAGSDPPAVEAERQARREAELEAELAAETEPVELSQSNFR